MLRGFNEQKHAWSPLEKYPLSINSSVCYVIYIVLKNFLPVQNIEKFLPAIFTARV
jgi:hypothetical protein